MKSVPCIANTVLGAHFYSTTSVAVKSDDSGIIVLNTTQSLYTEQDHAVESLAAKFGGIPSARLCTIA